MQGQLTTLHDISVLLVVETFQYLQETKNSAHTTVRRLYYTLAIATADGS